MVDVEEHIFVGAVVIVDTGQAGTVIHKTSQDIWVLLTNLDLWRGKPSQARIPQCAEDLAAAVLDVDRYANRPKKTCSPSKSLNQNLLPED